MNYHQRAVLRVAGVLLFFFALFFMLIVIPKAQDISLADNICNFRVSAAGIDFDVGQYAQNVLDSRAECTKIHFLKLGVDYSWIILVGGVVLFFIGVWTGLGAKDKRKL